MKIARDPGLGTKYKNPVKRIMNPDGSYNIHRIGGLNKFQDIYKHLIDLSWQRFILYVVLFYFSLNLIFSSVYYLIGVNQLTGHINEDYPFYTAFFFSSQTLTTLGYGAIAPNSFSSNLVAMIEAFAGLLCFALVTGLLYGRFSKPAVKISFSKNIILTPFEDGMAMMFKMVNLRDNILLNTKVNAMLVLDKGGEADKFNKQYFDVKLETNSVYFFPLTWTLVHKIDRDSPIYDMNVDELRYRNAEVVVLVETFDETFGQTILKKHSYAQEQWKENVKFDTNFKTNEQGEVELFVNEIDKLIEL